MRNRPSLFEVISKAPQVHDSQRSEGLSWFKRRSDSAQSVQVVAEALTEEEAAAELAAQQAAAEEAARRKREKLEARRARKAERRAAREASRKARVESVARSGASVMGLLGVRVSQGRLEVSLNTTSCIVSAAVFCVLLLGAFSLGRRSAGKGLENGLAKAAALTGAKSAGHPAEDAMFGLEDAADGVSGMAAAGSDSQNPDLSHLLKPTDPQPAAAKANRPAKVSPGAASATPGAKKLNYLEIQYFRITVEMSSEDLRRDLDDVRRFLSEHGIATFARRHPKGFVLYAAKGFPLSSNYRAQRDAFRRRVEQLGRTYRRSGGRYEFKGCYFVNYRRATSGDPV